MPRTSFFKFLLVNTLELFSIFKTYFFSSGKVDTVDTYCASSLIQPGLLNYSKNNVRTI